MSKEWVDIIVKIVVEVVDFVANMLTEGKGNENNDGKGTSEKK
jgi:hypothetical protein